MAAVERGEGADDAVIRGWLARALTAPRGPQWCCDKCQAIHTQWVPVCDNCAGFDTLSWREPADATGPSATGTELLPLIIGKREQTAISDQTPESDGPEDAEIVSDPAAEKTEKIGVHSLKLRWY